MQNSGEAGPSVPPAAWRARFDERQQKEIRFCELYAREFGHGTDGHNSRLVIAKMAVMLDEAERALTAWARDEAAASATAELASAPFAERLEALAMAAYVAYGAVTGNKNYQGLPMPCWADLPPKIREAWRAAADMVRMLTAR